MNLDFYFPPFITMAITEGVVKLHHTFKLE